MAAAAGCGEATFTYAADGLHEVRIRVRVAVDETSAGTAGSALVVTRRNDESYCICTVAQACAWRM